MGKLLLWIHTTYNWRKRPPPVVPPRAEVETGKDGFLQQLVDAVAAEVTKKTVNSIRQSLGMTMQTINKKVDDAVKATVPSLINEEMKRLSIPRLMVLPKKSETDVQKPQIVHHKFDEIVNLVEVDMPTMLKGPAGSGKNHTIGQVAEALGLKMYYTNNASNEFKLTGFKSASGEYQATEFYRAFKNGGIFFLDEIDTSDPTALITLNSAIANGYMAFPHETIDRHKNFRIVAAANTWGTGANTEYVGRNQLDASTLDRFYAMDFPYDKGVERAICPNDTILHFMWALRSAAEENKVRLIVSTRGIEKFYRLAMQTKIPVEQIMRGLVIKGQSKDTLDKLVGKVKQTTGLRKNVLFDKFEAVIAGKQDPTSTNANKEPGDLKDFEAMAWLKDDE